MKKLLYEINEVFVAQKDPGLKTRWFRSEESDLFIWQNSSGEIVYFQLSFKAGYVEWDKEKKLKTGVVDEEEYGGKNRSPLVSYHLYPDWQLIRQITTQFKEVSVRIDTEVRDFVLQVLTT